MSEDLDLVLGPNSCEEITDIDTDDLVEKLKLYEVSIRRKGGILSLHSTIFVVAVTLISAMDKAIVDCKKDDPEGEFEVVELKKIAEVDRNLVL